mmetsp:Transcript_17466/g.37941  ORF Transcript_17466/g.37941 Transcript_17466/m.37941 type:complete len:545 (+) Transcript_17466:82-1716(+)
MEPASRLDGSPEELERTAFLANYNVSSETDDDLLDINSRYKSSESISRELADTSNNPLLRTISWVFSAPCLRLVSSLAAAFILATILLHILLRQLPSARRLPQPSLAELDLLSSGDVERHIRTLSSPTFQGRAVGTPGELKSATYIASELLSAGFSPAADPSSSSSFPPLQTAPSNNTSAFFQQVPLLAFRTIPHSAQLSLSSSHLPNPLNLRFGYDFSLSSERWSSSPSSSSSSSTSFARSVPAPVMSMNPRRDMIFIAGASATVRRSNKTLVLDLDETLVHAMTKPPCGSSNNSHTTATGAMWHLFSFLSRGYDLKLDVASASDVTTTAAVAATNALTSTNVRESSHSPVLSSGGARARTAIDGGGSANNASNANKSNANKTTFYVRKRPHVRAFLRAVACWYRVVVFTASVKRYADAVIDAVDEDGVVSERYFRDSCVSRGGGQYVKDLSIVEPNLARVLLIDNTPSAYAMHGANAFPIETWFGDPNDEALLDALPFLYALAPLEDVRSVLGLRATGGVLNQQLEASSAAAMTMRVDYASS